MQYKLLEIFIYFNQVIIFNQCIFLIVYLHKFDFIYNLCYTFFSTQLIFRKEVRYVMKIFSAVNYIYPSLRSPDKFAEEEILHLVNYRLLERYNSNRAPTSYNPITFKIDPRKPFYPKLRDRLKRKLSKCGYEVRVEPEGTFKVWARREPRWFFPSGGICLLSFLLFLLTFIIRFYIIFYIYIHKRCFYARGYIYSWRG